MIGAIGILVIFIMVFGGYLLAGGKLGIILKSLPFEMIMIGGAGVISGAILGGFILGMMESVGLTLLASSGEITYLAIFASLMVFLAVRPQGLMGKPWG
jgi:branched-subunit amino acid ABC-type transport system permease component